MLSNASALPLWTLDSAPIGELITFLERIAKHYRNRHGRDIPPNAIPNPAELEQMVTTAFWASMIPDEGRFSPFQLVFAPPEDGCLCIAERPLTPEAVARLAPVTAAGARIGIRRGPAGLTIWGLNPGPTSHLEMRGKAPGHVLVAMAFWNLAVFKSNGCRILVRSGSDGGIHGLGRDRFALLVAEAFASTQRPAQRIVTAIVLLMALDSMRSHGNGGILLVLPEKPEHRDPALTWLDFGSSRLSPEVSLARAYEEYVPTLEKADDPLATALEIPGLGAYVQGSPEKADHVLLRAAKILGSLSAIDGAVVVSETLEVLGFGATILPPATSSPTDRIYRRSFLDYDGSTLGGEEVEISRVGGTRRQSAARFVANNYDSLALTASHDGPLSLVMWVLKQADRAEPRAHLMTELETMLD